MWLDLARLGEQGLPKKRRLGSGRREKRVRRSVSFFFSSPHRIWANCESARCQKIDLSQKKVTQGEKRLVSSVSKNFFGAAF